MFFKIYCLVLNCFFEIIEWVYWECGEKPHAVHFNVRAFISSPKNVVLVEPMAVCDVEFELEIY